MKKSLLILVLSLQGCGDPGETKDETADTSGADTSVEPFIPTLPMGGCGLDDTTWLSTERMGEIVEFEAMDAYSMDSTTIDGILALEGITSFSPLPYGVRSYRIRYLTQDRGELIETTAILSFPDAPKGTEVPIMLFGHGTSGFTDACAPSGAGLEGFAFPMLFAAQGYAVVGPDYLGMNGFGSASESIDIHPYLVPEAAAVASLDAVRALLRIQQEQGFPTRGRSDEVVFLGASEGGFAVLWADRYLQGYAPELTLKATAALVPPMNLTGLAIWGMQNPGSSTAPAVAGALASEAEWYRVKTPLSEILTDEKPRYVATNLPTEMASSCSDWPSVEGYKELTELYQESFLKAALAGDIDAIEPWSCLFGTADLASTAIPRDSDVPVFIQLSEADDLVPADPNREVIPTLCAQGYRIEYRECAGADHTDGAVATLPTAIQWLQDRLTNTDLGDRECVIEAPVDCGKIQ